MDRRIASLLLASIVCVCSCAPDLETRIREGARDKNIVLVLVDAAAWAHFSAAGYHRPTTPNFDALAAESVVFRNGYSPAASTSHAVFTMLSSTYPFYAEKKGLEEGILADPFHVTESTPLMAELLAPAFAHRSGISGNPWFGPDFELDRGFTHFYPAYDNAAVPDSTKKRADTMLDLFRIDLDVWDGGRAFVYAHFLEPHSPYTPPDRFARLYHPTAIDEIDASSRALIEYRLVVPDQDRQEKTVALYDANLTFVDAAVGDMVAELKARGIWDETIFLVVADHGEAFWQHGVFAHGRHIYEEFVHIPFLIRIPGVPELAGLSIDQNVSLVDLLPTFLDFAGLEIPDELRGDSLLPLLAGRTRDFEQRMVYLRNTHSVVPEYGLRVGRWKWIYRVYQGQYLLFDLESDPLEQNDLVAADAVPAEAARYKEEVAFWIAKGTGRIEDAPTLDERTKQQLRSIGYF